MHRSAALCSMAAAKHWTASIGRGAQKPTHTAFPAIRIKTIPAIKEKIGADSGPGIYYAGRHKKNGRTAMPRDRLDRKMQGCSYIAASALVGWLVSLFPPFLPIFCR